MIYLAVLIIGAGFSIQNGKSKGFFYSYLFLLLTLACFRYGVGPDYFAYEFLYKVANTSVLDQFDDSGQELLFRLLGSALQSIDFTYQEYVALTALITLYYIGKTCKRYSHYPVVSLFFYYCFFYFVWVFSGIRQGLALAIGVYYLLECLENRNHIKFAIITILLTMIHASSAILPLFYVIAHLNLRRQTLLTGVFFCFCISLIPATYLMEVFSRLPYGDRIDFYFRRGNPEDFTISYFDFKSIARFVLLILFGVLFARSYDRSNGIQSKIMNVYVVSFGIYYALRFLEILASNASIYGFVLIVLILPNMYGRLKTGPNFKVFLISVSILSIAFFFKTLFSMEDMSKLNHSSLITPYTNIFNKSEYSFPLRVVE